jgi:hypothetical protein
MIPAPAFTPGQSPGNDGHRDPPPVRVELPPGWQPRTPNQKIIAQQAAYPDLNAYLQLLIEPRSDFADGLGLMGWSKLVQSSAREVSKLANRKETKLREGRISGRAVVEYEVTGESEGMKLHFRHSMLEAGDYYCHLICWTVPSHWEEAQGQFEGLVGRVKWKEKKGLK